MKTLSFERLANPEFLRTIHPKIFYDFILRYENYFKSLQIELKLLEPKDKDAYWELARPLMNPGVGAPLELFDELFLIYSADSLLHYDKLLDIINKSEYKNCLEQYDNPTIADLAALVVINNKRDLERLCIEQDLNKRKSYMCYVADKNIPEKQFIPINQKRLDELTELFNYHFMLRKRGKRSAEIIYEQPDTGTHQFIIRKGAPMSRQEAVEESGNSVTAIFRPAIYDLVVFRPLKRELKISMPQVSEWSLALYRKKFGEFLYNDEEYFSGNDLISLNPIKKYGRDVLKCDDIVDENGFPLIDNVRMTSCSVLYDQENDEEILYKGNSVFKLWERQDIQLEDEAEPVRATFKIRPKHSSKECPVAISQGNKASYMLDNYSPAIELWLAAREFISGMSDDVQ